MTWFYFDAVKFGLVHVTAVDWLAGDGCYEWDETTVLWSPTTKLFYWEHGSGCSCNGPLDDVDSRDDLKVGTFWDLVRDLQSVLIEYVESSRKDAVTSEVVASLEIALKVWDSRDGTGK